MSASYKITLKKLCCTCLSKDRKLFQLCKLTDGINTLYSMLSHDSEAYREGFFREATSLHVCWECRAIMCRFATFRQQACVAQQQLDFILDGRCDKDASKSCLSRLSVNHKSTYDTLITSEETNSDLDDYFIDCGPVDDVKVDDIDDLPLSKLQFFYAGDKKDANSKQHLKGENVNIQDVEINNYKKKKKSKLKKAKNKRSELEIMTEEEMLEIRERQRTVVPFTDAAYKCDSCIEGFSSQIDLDAHNFNLHIKKDNHTQCTICSCYISNEYYDKHRMKHYKRIRDKTDKHKNNSISKSPSSKQQRNHDKATSEGYKCAECDKYFVNKNKRWKHVQRDHRAGHECATCGKRFAFNYNLKKHQLSHTSPPPRIECAVCHKQIRADLAPVHARIHRRREPLWCLACRKPFASRASYRHHLNYTGAHVTRDLLRYKCGKCHKGYRSRGELNDHINYQHEGKTTHKCPVCGKALATPRCITRHVRRAHQGVKEGVKDKICQQCGKAFRDKKGLHEHELIHSGARPLSCEVCGCSFRQRASLYTHRKRLHNIYPTKHTLTLVQDNSTAGECNKL